MPLKTIGTSPDQVLPNGLFTVGAGMEDLMTLFAPALTLDLLRGTPNQLAKIVGITNATVKGFFFYDSTDTTTADDGKDTLVTVDGKRYKRRTLIRNYTPTSGSDTSVEQGSIVFDNNGIWIKTGASTVMIAQFVRSGNTASRPTLTAAHTGFQYYDTTLSKPVWYTGSGTTWKDATGTTV